MTGYNALETAHGFRNAAGGPSLPAAGENLRVRLPGGKTRLQSGSSFAVPLVAALLCLLLGHALFELKTLLKHNCVI